MGARCRFPHDLHDPKAQAGTAITDHLAVTQVRPTGADAGPDASNAEGYGAHFSNGTRRRYMTDSLMKIALLTMAAGLAGAGCRAQTIVNTDGEGSEVATSVVGGALNNTTGSAVALSGSWQRHQRATLDKLIDLLSPVRPA